METERAKRLAGFVSWVGANIKGDEKGEAQVFLDRFFQAFGHAGLKEAGATLEERIKKSDGKGTSFADLVWKPVVLIEMKKRGEDLTRHYWQAFDYWTRLVPGRPRLSGIAGHHAAITTACTQVSHQCSKALHRQIACRSVVFFLRRTDCEAWAGATGSRRRRSSVNSSSSNRSGSHTCRRCHST